MYLLLRRWRLETAQGHPVRELRDHNLVLVSLIFFGGGTRQLKGKGHGADGDPSLHLAWGPRSLIQV